MIFFCCQNSYFSRLKFIYVFFQSQSLFWHILYIHLLCHFINLNIMVVLLFSFCVFIVVWFGFLSVLGIELSFFFSMLGNIATELHPQAQPYFESCVAVVVVIIIIFQVFIIIIILSHITYQPQFSLHPFLTVLTSSSFPRSTPPLFLFRKEQGSHPGISSAKHGLPFTRLGSLLELAVKAFLHASSCV